MRARATKSRAAAWLACLLALGAHAQSEELVGLSEDELADDEAGLWMLAEKQEQDIRTGSLRVDAPDLEAHIESVLCELVGESCSFLRPYVVRWPGFNAFVLPNGAIFLQTGLLLRVANDHELAAVLGHEAAHYFRRDNLTLMRRTRRTSYTIAVIGAVVDVAGDVGWASADSIAEQARVLELSETAWAMLHVGGVLAQLQLLRYSRAMETKADLDSLGWLASASYRPADSVAMWESLHAEHSSSGDNPGLSLLSTHPAPEARMTALRERAATLEPAEAGPTEGSSRIAMLVDRHREDWLTDEMSVLHPDQYRHVLAQQVDRGYPPHAAAYLEGMSYANRARHANSTAAQQQFHLQQAVRAFDRAIELGGDSVRPETWRELGKAHEALGDDEQAKEAYRRYVTMAPDAWDAKFLRRKL